MIPSKYKIIDRLGGLTNTNYLIEHEGQKYVYRKAGEGTEVFLNRKEELYNTEIAMENELYPMQLFFDDKTGDKITLYLKNAVTLNGDLLKQSFYLNKVADSIRKLHKMNRDFGNEFLLKNLMNYYETLCKKENVQFPKNYDEMKKNVLNLYEKFKLLNVEYRPCHIDPLCENFLWEPNENKLYIIDFEYSGMFDPLWDIAAIALEGNFDEEQLFEFTKIYLNCTELEDDIKQRLFYHSVFQDYLWYLWAAFKTAWGEDFVEYRDFRWNRLCKKFLHGELLK